MGTVRLLETDLQTQIMNYLRLLENKGYAISAYRVFNGPKIHTVRKRVIYSKNPSPGFPDLVVLIPSKTWFVELKTETGKMSDYQLKFQSNCLKTNNIYKIWRHMDNAITDLAKEGFKP